MTNYPHGVSTHHIPGWIEMTVDACQSERLKYGDTEICRERCGKEQFFECALELHSDEECGIDRCPICENRRVEMEYLREGKR